MNFPFSLCTELLRLDSDEVGALISYSRKLYDDFLHEQSKNAELTREIQRVIAENKFLTQLAGECDDDQS